MDYGCINGACGGDFGAAMPAMPASDCGCSGGGVSMQPAMETYSTGGMEMQPQAYETGGEYYGGEEYSTGESYEGAVEQYAPCLLYTSDAADE